MRWTRIGGMAALVAALAIGLALSLGLWGSWTASAQDTFIVNDDTAPAIRRLRRARLPERQDIETVIDDDRCRRRRHAGPVPGHLQGRRRRHRGGGQEAHHRGPGRPPTGIEIVIQVPAAGTDGLAIKATGVTIRHLKLGGPAVATATTASRSMPATRTIEDVESNRLGRRHRRLLDERRHYPGQPHPRQSSRTAYSSTYANNVRIAHNILDGASPFAIRIDTADLAVVEDNAIAAGIPSSTWLSAAGATFKSCATPLRPVFSVTDSSGGIDLDLPAEALVIIGGSDANANTFDGDLASGRRTTFDWPAPARPRSMPPTTTGRVAP